MPPKRRQTGQKLLRFDRALGARLVAGADEAGRGPLAGPLVVAGVLLDYGRLHDHRVRPLALLNDSKQVDAATRDELYHAVISCAEAVSVRVFPAAVIDRDGLHRCNLRGLREALVGCGPADVYLVDGFKLGPGAPPHRAIVDGDTKSAAIAAASIIAKVTRDRYMRTADALYPGYGFASHVGYITQAHTDVVRERGPCEIHRRSWRARAYLPAA
ncbi:MAG TPA: ribonuclease HII [Gaiellaceae bacterium]|nr:ribonuclease HII [Gaiellaceae bacterium]